ncbi:hypothetical protein VKT23_002931 [Stygiomarasmius scandens]|uniref:Uncharacterized protein n=1 Tax=Marasmiellus scandens TaxID=2682957 RepID=A0ABR1JVL7_9AGAR
MSSSTTSSYYKAVKAERLSQLFSILKRAKERQNAITEAFRRTLRPTQHARRRANQLRLSIDITKAVNCDMRVVAKNPLPILDPTLTPGELPPRAASEDVQERVYRVPIGHGRPKPVIPRIVIPGVGDERRQPRPSSVPQDVTVDFDIHALSGLSAVSGLSGLSNLSALSFPSAVTDPIAGAPTVLRNPNAPWVGPTSRFSITPTDPIFHVRDSKLGHLIRDCGAPKACDGAQPRHGLELERGTYTAAQGSGSLFGEYQWIDRSSSNGTCDMDTAMVDIPISDVSDDCGYSSATESVESQYSQRSEGTSFSSRSSSSGPATPDDMDMSPPPMISIKRKSAELDGDDRISNRFAGSYEVVEKAPKYTRKHWSERSPAMAKAGGRSRLTLRVPSVVSRR